jgi:hypothetical protein
MEMKEITQILENLLLKEYVIKDGVDLIKITRTFKDLGYGVTHDEIYEKTIWDAAICILCGASKDMYFRTDLAKVVSIILHALWPERYALIFS